MKLPSQVESNVVPLVIQSKRACPAPQPITIGVPLPRGFLRQANQVYLCNAAGESVLVQAEALARWSDDSVKWLLVDFVAQGLAQGNNEWSLVTRVSPRPQGRGVRSEAQQITVQENGRTSFVATGAATFFLNTSRGLALQQVLVGSQVMPSALRAVLVDRKGRRLEPKIESAQFETAGPVRVTLRLEGSFRNGLRLVARLCFFAQTGLMRARVTLHNPKRARHPGGMWDLGDPGSIQFREFSLQLTPKCEAALHYRLQAEPSVPSNDTTGAAVLYCNGHGRWVPFPQIQGQADTEPEIYQDSSGGENWQSPNHVDRDGRVQCRFRGYRVRQNGQEQVGRRASPVLIVEAARSAITVGVPEFWQQFPKALEVAVGVVKVGLFPGQSQSAFELQGGEQKTHAFWLNFGPAGDAEHALEWVHGPATACATPAWHARSGVFPHLLSSDAAPHAKLDAYLAEVLEGSENLFARREDVDEYGWRHFGEIYADHEREHYDGPAPHISHYNNQYDFLGGAIAQYLRTGNVRWFDLIDPLARHVIDIDIYHTDEDRAAYNGGLFWFTDHYKTAATCTHRTYSRANCTPGDRTYGGGPSSNHNFTTGLLHYYYLTGDLNARAAVLSLADWVVNMDDGCKTVFRLIDDGPSGLATCTASLDYHGPGRGAGNSINALLDGWLVTAKRAYLDKAEEFIRRCIHPNDDVAARELLDVEKRWSYTVFLVVLDRYLRAKAERNELDFMYAYARASLLGYAQWMVDNEKPYFDQPEKLEYPTEAWAGQEFRKANVLRLAAAYADEPLRARLLRRGQELADRAWYDLERFATRYSARGIALVMAEGPLDAMSRVTEIEPMPRPERQHAFGTPVTFVSQKQRVMEQLQSARGIGKTLIQVANPMRWLRAPTSSQY
ncbi:MAG: glycoside hydrolase family 127 protein [Gemmataceae bacterium]|nr:glycoside hydrolase family 127 protein [Gemmataceae bacterium]MCI0743368.1 glycoside hydrolase family 127 protein [Gemmataceae bacterium]